MLNIGGDIDDKQRDPNGIMFWYEKQYLLNTLDMYTGHTYVHK